MHARVSFYDMGSASRDDAAAAFDEARNVVEQVQGNQGGMLLLNPDGQKAITIILYDSEEAVRASDERAQQIRGQFAERAGLSVRDVEPYEVVREFRRGS